MWEWEEAPPILLNDTPLTAVAHTPSNHCLYCISDCRCPPPPVAEPTPEVDLLDLAETLLLLSSAVNEVSDVTDHVIDDVTPVDVIDPMWEDPCPADEAHLVEMYATEPSTSWDDYVQDLTVTDFIQEVYMEESPQQQIEAPTYEGERKKYQRFRDKKYICDYCDRHFTLKQNVQQHIMHYHMGSVQLKERRGKRYKCIKCNQVFKTLDSARKHEERVHGEKANGGGLYPCKDCAKIYPNYAQLQEHVRIQHLQLRPHACEQCGMRFGRRGGLRRHIVMVHTGRLFKCSFPGCDHPGYKCTKALAAHVRSVHTMDRPFECLFCEKSFVRKNDLKMHELTHSATSDHLCDKCGQGFKRQLYLLKHQRICSGPKPKKVKAEPKSTATSETDEPPPKPVSKPRVRAPRLGSWRPRGLGLSSQREERKEPPPALPARPNRPLSKQLPPLQNYRPADKKKGVDVKDEVEEQKKVLEEGEIDSDEEKKSSQSRKRAAHANMQVPLQKRPLPVPKRQPERRKTILIPIQGAPPPP